MMNSTLGRTRARNPNQDAVVRQLSGYSVDGLAPSAEPDAEPVPPPAQPEPPPPPAYTPRINPDGSVEAPEPGEPGYVAPGAAAPAYVPPNGNTGIGGGIPHGPLTPSSSLPGDPTGTFPTNSGPIQTPASAYAAIPGFDLEKLNGTKPYDSAEKYSDAVRLFSRGLGAGVPISRNNLGPMVDYAHANGFPNAFAVGDDKIDWDGPGGLPPDDLIRSDGLIVFQHGSDAQQGGGGVPNGPVGGGTLPSPVGTQVGGSATGANGEVNNAFQQALVRILNQKDPSLADPALAAQSQANRIAQQRSSERRRAAAAEQRTNAGQTGGALSADVDNILSAQGDAVGAFDADLLGRAYDKRDQQVLAALSPALAAMGLDQQQRQFVLDRAQNDRQYLQDLALRLGIANATFNQNAVVNLLSGL